METRKLTPKDRAYLKSLANSISNRYLMGKGEPDESFYTTIDNALEAHELIKIGILQNSESDKNELADDLCNRLGCQIVQIIGRVIVLYRRSKKHPKIEL